MPPPLKMASEPHQAFINCAIQDFKWSLVQMMSGDEFGALPVCAGTITTCASRSRLNLSISAWNSNLSADHDNVAQLAAIAR